MSVIIIKAAQNKYLSMSVRFLTAPSSNQLLVDNQVSHTALTPIMASYHVPQSLTIISAAFLGIGAICALVVIGDMVWRRGWKSMMAVMIPVWPINATYMGPITLFLYFKYGRPSKPGAAVDGHDHSHMGREHSYADAGGDAQPDISHPTSAAGDLSNEEGMEKRDAKIVDYQSHHMHDMSGDRPMWTTVMIGVSHCGAGCVLGDIVGEWLVYGTGANINGNGIWVEILVDYAFALLFGIIFQYFSIAPMSGDYGPKSVVRAMKADILSLTSFEVGLFGWMIIYQVGIWDYQLPVDSATYWWMMQVGMFLGSVTAMPVNWWLIKKGIKEPCA